MDYVRRAVWGMLYADDASIVPRSPQGLAKMMEVIVVEVCRAFALTVSAKKTETMSMPPPRTPRTMVQVEAVGQTYKQVQTFTYLGCVVTVVPDCPLKSPDGPAHAGCASGGTYGNSTANRKSRSPSRPEWLRRRQSRPSCMDAVRGPFRQEHYAKLRTVYHRVLLRIIGAQRKRPDHRMTSYNRVLKITRCESIETTLRTRKLLWAGTLLRMSGGRLPKRIVSETLRV